MIAGFPTSLAYAQLLRASSGSLAMLTARLILAEQTWMLISALPIPRNALPGASRIKF